METIRVPESDSTTATPDETAEAASGPLPGGDHPLEIAARKGYGPLSPHAQRVWHGNARPCVSCGMLVMRDQRECDHCGQDLSDDMLEKMRAHAGPWYVFEHLHPFPGVSLDRIVRQIRRGVLTETSIIRGPGTHFQWRFAGETPSLCRHFGKCWSCHGAVVPSELRCPHCLSLLDDDASPRPATPQPPSTPAVSPNRAADQPSDSTHDWQALSAALSNVPVPQRDDPWHEAPRSGRTRAAWVAVVLLLLVIAALFWITTLRSTKLPTRTAQAAPMFINSA